MFDHVVFAVGGFLVFIALGNCLSFSIWRGKGIFSNLDDSQELGDFFDVVWACVSIGLMILRCMHIMWWNVQSGRRMRGMNRKLNQPFFTISNAWEVDYHSLRHQKGNIGSLEGAAIRVEDF